MALLAVPGLGIIFSALTLGETVGPSLTTGVFLVGVGIGLATMAAPNPRRQVVPPEKLDKGVRHHGLQ